jgi:hypothetical protein
MKRFIMILCILFVAAGFASAQVKISTDNYVYGYLNAATGVPSFEVNPSVKLAVDKLAITAAADGCFKDFSGLTSGNLSLKAAYDLGFMSIYAKGYFYLAQTFGVDTAATFNVPHFPVTLEYTASDVNKPGTVTAYVEITF